MVLFSLTGVSFSLKITHRGAIHGPGKRVVSTMVTVLSLPGGRGAGGSGSQGRSHDGSHAQGSRTFPAGSIPSLFTTYRRPVASSRASATGSRPTVTVATTVPDCNSIHCLTAP